MKAKNVPVALQSATETRSATGQVVNTWATYATVGARVVDLRGASYYAAEQTANEIVAEIYIWYRTDVQPKHRVVMRGQTYEIAAPPANLNMKNRELLLRLRQVE